MNTPERYSPAISLLWMVAAPTVVLVTLLAWRNVWATFALYHIGTCLFVPVVDRHLIRGDSWRGVCGFLGLCGPRLGAGMRAGVILGLVMAAGIVVFFRLYGGNWLDAAAVQDVLARWGVTPSRTTALMLFMVLGNGAAEEIFWRGWIHHRLAGWRPRVGAHFVAAFFYASYHMVTVTLFVGDRRVAVLLLLTTLAAGIFWAWLRERYGTIWPALISHVGATLGYMAVYATQIVP